MQLLNHLSSWFISMEKMLTFFGHLIQIDCHSKIVFLKKKPKVTFEISNIQLVTKHYPISRSQKLCKVL